MKKKIRFILLTIILILITLLIVSVSINKTKQTVKADESTETTDATPTLKVECTKYDGDNFIPDSESSLKIYIKFSLTNYTNSSTSTQEITVKFHAEDRSAVSAAGDYYYEYSGSSSATASARAEETHEVRELTFTAGQVLQISYVVSKPTFVAKNTSSAEYYYPYFVFVVDEVEGANLPTKVSGDKTETVTEFNCELYYYTYVYPVSKVGSRMVSVVENHLWNRCEKSCKLDRHNYDSNQEWKPVWDIFSTTTFDEIEYSNQALINTYVKTGLCDMTGNYWSRMTRSSSIYTEDCHTELKIDGKTYGSYQTDNFKTADNDLTINSEYRYRTSGANTDKYFIIPDNCTTMQTINWSNHQADTYVTVSINTRLEDLTSPTCVSAYADASSMMDRNVLRIAIRFSEPVQVTDTNAYIEAYINTSTKYKFNYAGGSCTNTLYFEAQMTDSNSTISKINNFKLSNNLIYDLGTCYNTDINKLQKAEFSYDIKCSYDFRTPSLTASVSNPSVVTYNKMATVTVSKIIKGARLYYSWKQDAKESNDSKDYQAYIDLDSVKNDEITVNPSGDNMYGEYYLHLLVVSYYGKTKSLVLGRGKNGEVTSGGFLFDNKSPEITETKLLIDKLTNRTLSISAYEGSETYDSGLQSIYCRISEKSDMSEYLDYCIWDRTSNQTTLGIRDDVYSISTDAQFYYLELNTDNKYDVKSTNLVDSSTYDYHIFSSKEKATEYIRLSECRDMEMIILSDTTAAYLSTDSNGYIRASGETEVPETGQKWIRYKNGSFSTDGSLTSLSWVYYYYKGADKTVSSIDIDDLSENLNSALDSNSEYFINKWGSEIRSLIKTDVVTESGLPDTSKLMYYTDTTSFSSAYNTTAYKNSLSFSDPEMKINTKDGKGTLSLVAADDGIVKVVENSFKIYYIGFYAIDQAGNSSVDNLTYKKYKFDRRGTFNSNIYVQQSGRNATSIDENINAYDISKDEVKLIFEAILDAQSEEQGTLEISLVKYGSEYLDDSTANGRYYKIEVSGDGHTLTFTPKYSGYYEVETKLVDGESERVSKTYEMYITDGFMDDTENKSKTEGNLVLTNNVYQLGSKFYYLNKTNEIIAEDYGGSAAFATFSSGNEARNYIQYMEYQDMYLVTLNEYMVQMLSSTGGGSSNYILASNESHEIKEGQKWIRYKRDTWTQTSTTNDWVYYYYSDTLDTITFTNLSTNIQNALSKVVDTIYSYGTYVALVGSTHIDSNGAPKLLSGQIHFEAESASVSKCGSVFTSSAQYAGDKSIYSNKVDNRIDKEEVPICTNMDIKISDSTVLEYAYYDGSVDEENLTFTMVQIPYGVTDTTLKNILSGCGTGTYIIKEFDDNGASTFKIYFDKTAPSMHLTYTSTVEGKSYSFTVDSEQNGQTFNAKSFSLGELDSQLEYDEHSYVAVYKNPSLAYIDTYFYDDLLNDSISLDEGNYYIEVGDRSGNIYSFIIQVCTTKMEATVKTVENQYISIEVNRTKDQIKTYSVKVDGQVVDSEWDGDTKKYKDAGFYEIVIEDIYGYSYTLSGEGGVGYQFTREFPSVQWSYSNNAGGWVTYDSTKTTLVRIIESIGGYRYVSSSRTLRFKLDGQYAFTITGISKEYYTENTVTGLVTINTQDPYTVIVYYKDFPDIKTTYSVTTDILAPTIYPSYKVTSYLMDEDNYFASLNDSELVIGNIYNPTNLNYYASGVNENYISEKEYIDSNLINLSVTDESGLSFVQIYLDGELFKELIPEDGVIDSQHLSRYGHYEIIAEDVFGNRSTTEFYNTSVEQVSYSIDDNIIARTTDTLYGNNNVLVELMSDGNLYILSTDSNGKQYFIMYSIASGEVSRCYYKVVAQDNGDGTEKLSYQSTNETTTELDNMGNEFERNVTVFSTTDAQFKADKWYELEKITIDEKTEEVLFNVNIYCKYDKDGNLYFKVEGDGSRTNIDIRITLGEQKEPFLYKGVLSTEKTDALLQTSSDKYIETNQNNDMIYVNKPFYLASSIDTLVTKIEMGYSEMNEFNTLTQVYPADESGSILDFDASLNGFYKIVITNKFGNTNEYIINKSDIFTLITVAKYDDETESRFDNNYTDLVKSNRKVTIEAYASMIDIECYKDGELFKCSSKYEDGYYTILLNEIGRYDLTITDTFGNTFNRSIDIKESQIQYNENYIYGYNESALRKEDGYTNQLLSISDEEMTINGIKYISIIKDDKENIIYNGLTQYYVEYDKDALIDAIGNDGDGIYTVVFRDAYGSTAKKVIHYRSTPTLHITRTTRTSKDAVEQDINDVILNGVWSNAIIDFSTDATYYTFEQFNEDTSEYITREITESFSLATTADNIHREYKVHYIDEYGFEYTIDVYLLRVQLSIELDGDISVVNIGNVDTTKDNLVLSYSDNSTLTYTIDGQNQKTYTKGSTLYKDGLYRFTCVDKAGNLQTKTIKKDTIVEFQFVNSSDGRTLINGEAATSKRVDFKAINDDTTFIKTIYLDGVKQENTDIASLTEAGKYSIILEDKIGNNTMFEFIIINHALKEFTYTTPNNYFISDLWYNSADEVSISYIENVTNTDLNSTFSINENGYYTVVLMSKVYNDGMTFSFEINNTPPAVSLVGCEENETTIENISVSGFEIGDTILVYKDGILDSTTEITSKNIASPVIDKGGKYTIVVRNEAGAETTLTFNRIYVPNQAGSVLIIAICFAGVVAILIGMILKNKQKFDD